MGLKNLHSLNSEDIISRLKMARKHNECILYLWFFLHYACLVPQIRLRFIDTVTEKIFFSDAK